MFYTKMATALLASTMALCVGNFAQAGEFSSGFYDGHSGQKHHREARPSIAGGNGLPSYLKGVGTYAGGISAVRFRGNGNYFSVDAGSFNRNPAMNGNAVRSRIIEVNSRTMGAECSYEAGVCVIRP